MFIASTVSMILLSWLGMEGSAKFQVFNGALTLEF